MCGVRTYESIRRSRRTVLERLAKQGESPVVETETKHMSIQSTIEHEKFGGNEGGPSPKAKYDLMTDRV